MAGPTFADLMTVGFKSDDPATWPSRRVANVVKARDPTSPTTFNIEKEHTNMAVIDPSDDPLDSAKAEIDALMGQINSYLAASDKTFMLGEPTSLTVKKANGQYSKRPHIGGEFFRPIRVYLGKREKLIYVFNPVEVADYVEMEMEETEAREKFAGLGSHINRAGNGEMERLKREARERKAVEAERQKLAERAEQYGDLGFGSW